jgi:hypothetical protein
MYFPNAYAHVHITCKQIVYFCSSPFTFVLGWAQALLLLPLAFLVQWQCPVADRREKLGACGEGPISAQKSKDLFMLK